jgi:AcrR family transcriptional regulator
VENQSSFSLPQRSGEVRVSEVNPLLPREPQRARGKARYEILLDAAEGALGERNGSELTLLDASSRAGVPLASVYHYFPSNVALLVGLARRYFRDLERLMAVSGAHDELGSWMDLCRLHAAAGRQYYATHPAAMRLLLGADCGTQVRQSDLDANMRFAAIQYCAYRRHFVLPPGQYAIDRCAIAITISDAIWSLSYSRYGCITDAMANEALEARFAFLLRYLPERAEKRAAPLESNAAHLVTF